MPRFTPQFYGREAQNGTAAVVPYVWYHTCCMRKTTVYLSDEEAAGLRHTAAASGRSQAELIRAAIRQLVAQAPERRFHSLGQGASTAAAPPHWNQGALYEKAFGRH